MGGPYFWNDFSKRFLRPIALIIKSPFLAFRWFMVDGQSVVYWFRAESWTVPRANEARWSVFQSDSCWPLLAENQFWTWQGWQKSGEKCFEEFDRNCLRVKNLPVRWSALVLLIRAVTSLKLGSHKWHYFLDLALVTLHGAPHGPQVYLILWVSLKDRAKIHGTRGLRLVFLVRGRVPKGAQGQKNWGLF